VYKETGTIIPAPNSRFTKAGGSCFYESEVLNSSFVHLMKFNAEKPRLRKAAERWQQYFSSLQINQYIRTKYKQ
jgi:hypothetical protein